MNIDSTWVSKNKDTGIYYIIINTFERWINYQINRTIEQGKIILNSFTTYSAEYMPSQWDDYDEEEIFKIDIEEGFNPCDYLITSMQEKDQIILICVPDKLILNHKFFERV